MTTVTINFPDRGLSGIHGVPAPCGRVCFHGGEVPHGAKLDAAYTVAVKHDGNSYHMHCHFGVEYLANRRRLAYYFQNEGLPPAELDDLGGASLMVLLPPWRCWVQNAYSLRGSHWTLAKAPGGRRLAKGYIGFA